MTDRQAGVVETAAREAFVAAWWDSFGDEEVAADGLLRVAREVEGFGFNTGRTRLRKRQLGKLLGHLRGCEIGGYRVMPNRMVRGAQMWRLVRLGDLPAMRAATQDAFVPSSEWQEIPDGYPCPPGGEFRMDFRTGRNWGRWPALSTEDTP